MAAEQATKVASYPIRFHPVLELIPAAERDSDPLYGEFGRRYYPAVFGSQLRDRSFSLSAAHGGHAIVECDLLDGALGRFGMPMQIIVTDPEPGRRRKLMREAVKTVSQIARENAAEALIADPGSRELVGELGLACLAAGGRMCMRMHAVIDLSRSEQELYADVRHSAKSLLNWGRRSLDLRYCNAANPDRAIFDAYRQLHREVAGRVTRGEASWNVMFDVLRRGRGELVLGNLEGELVAGLLVVDGSHMCHYASGAYLRSRFDRPLAHWPLMDAIMRAKSRGMHRFEIGEVFFPGDGTAKEESIGMFKKAFTSRVELRAHWRLPGSQPRAQTSPTVPATSSASASESAR